MGISASLIADTVNNGICSCSVTREAQPVPCLVPAPAGSFSCCFGFGSMLGPPNLGVVPAHPGKGWEQPCQICTPANLLLWPGNPEARGSCPAAQQRLLHTESHTGSAPHPQEPWNLPSVSGVNLLIIPRKDFEVILREWKVTEQERHNSPNWIIKKKIKKCAKLRLTCGHALKIKRAFFISDAGGWDWWEEELWLLEHLGYKLLSCERDPRIIDQNYGYLHFSSSRFLRHLVLQLEFSAWLLTV